MLAYTLRRIVATIPVMAIVALFVFSLLYLAPGDPAAIIAGDQASPADVERIRESLGLDTGTSAPRSSPTCRSGT
jgi:peptide/nickel transport system permease protein